MSHVLEINKTLPTDIKRIIPFIDRVILTISPLLKSKNEIFIIKLALEEALTNAMRHGNKLNPKFNVKVSIEATLRKITLTIHDEGSGFDFAKVSDPTKKCRRVKFSGRGIFIMRSIMDRVSFRDYGRGIRLVKLLPRAHEK